jgi:hypothetical protein
MSEPTEEIAVQILEKMGVGPALVVSMRLVLLVGQERTETEGMLEAVKEAMAAIKRVGALAGTFTLG